ncbi:MULTISPECIES: fructosamine kinase family protein [unclassified Corynebacterium]|uniref:fructosamine kinase family protein n=1 Tax=unclassified Corynebacterium TaxID=2624378 RepID=UPI0034CFA6C8
MATFTKDVAQPDQAGAEAAGLRWLHAAVPEAVVEVVEGGQSYLRTERVEPAAPTAEAAREFGRRLRRIHAAGAEAFGCPPAGWEGKNFIGRVEQDCIPSDSWGSFYVEQRVLPFARGAGLSSGDLETVERACQAIAATDFDVEPARIHGDLWAGNLLFSEGGAVVIDPAAHGGHPHTDLAMLELFGAPYLDEILAGYGDPKVDFDLHQLHPLAVHAMTHGRAYQRPLVAAARGVLERY